MPYSISPASFGQQHTIAGIHQYTHDDLSDGFDQSYNHSLSTAIQGAAPIQSAVGASGALVPLRFASRAQAKAHQMNRKLTWRSPGSDVDRTVPQDDAQRSSYVHQFRTAMIEVGKTGPKLWKDKMAQGELSEIGDIESVCWDLIDLAEQLHKDGPQTLSIFSLRTLRDAALSKNFTFAGRIDAMIGLVLSSKTWVDSLIKGEKHATFVACAAEKSKATVQHRKSNKHNKEVLEVGYAPVKENKEEEITGEEGEDEDKGGATKDSVIKEGNAVGPAAAEPMRPMLTAANAFRGSLPRKTESRIHNKRFQNRSQPQTSPTTRISTPKLHHINRFHSRTTAFPNSYQTKRITFFLQTNSTPASTMQVLASPNLSLRASVMRPDFKVVAQNRYGGLFDGSAPRNSISQAIDGRCTAKWWR
jgi:hypothetical protein